MLLRKIVLCSWLLWTKFMNCKCFEMRVGRDESFDSREAFEVVRSDLNAYTLHTALYTLLPTPVWLVKLGGEREREGCRRPRSLWGRAERYIHTHTHTHICNYIFIYVYVYLYIYRCVHTYSYDYICIYIYTYISIIYINMYIYIYIEIYTTSVCWVRLGGERDEGVDSREAFEVVRSVTYTHTHTHTHTYM